MNLKKDESKRKKYKYGKDTLCACVFMCVYLYQNWTPHKLTINHSAPHIWLKTETNTYF